MIMEDVEDDAEFGSAFLDSMLEVEMTEEDGEVEISKDDDPLAPSSRILPPIPTFDLQSETLTYKDVYRNSILQPLLTNIPMVTPPPVSNFPTPVPVVSPRPLLTILSNNVLPINQLMPVAPQNSSVPFIKKASPKPPAKPPKKVTKDINIGDEVSGAQFVQQVFKREYARHVFVKKESSCDLSVVTKEEMKYYKSCFKDVSKVQFCRLHCTICNTHLGCAENIEGRVLAHKVLKVLTCKTCNDFYGDGKFPCDKGDNCEIYCRWCGQGGALVCCSFCPQVFCKKCVKQNFGRSFLREIQKASDWACFCCAPKPLWPHRAVCRALLEFFDLRKSGKATIRDPMKCCPTAILNDKKMSKSLEKVENPPAVTPPLKNKLTPQVKPSTGREQFMLRSCQKVNTLNKPLVKSEPRLSRPTRTNPGSVASVAERTVIAGDNVLRSGSATTTNKLLLSIPCPQLLQTPVVHGETLITPPGARVMVTSKPSPAPPVDSFVKVSLTNQVTNMDLSKIPIAKIPHDFQGLVLRLILPDNEVHLIRLVVDDSLPNDFPRNSKSVNGVVEDSLKEGFHFSRLFHDRLTTIREKSGKEDTAVEAAVKKLRFVYGKSLELLKELDKDLSGNFQEWKKNRTEKLVDVIELSDDDKKTSPEKAKKSRFMEKCKEFVLSDDSDIEILDEVIENTNTKTTGIVNGDLTEKYRLRGTVIERTRAASSKMMTRERNRSRVDAPTKAAEIQSSKLSRVQKGKKRKRTGKALGATAAICMNGVSSGRWV